MWLLNLLADSSGPSTWMDFSSLGIGALVAAPAYVALSVIWRSYQKEQSGRMSEREAREDRDRETIEKLASMLTTTTALMERVSRLLENRGS